MKNVPIGRKMTEEINDATAYKNGSFYDIKYPLNDSHESENCYKLWPELGYMKYNLGGSDEYNFEIWYAQNQSRDMDYPYFICCDVLSEGKMVFFTNFWDMLHFINNYGKFLEIKILQEIWEEIYHIKDRLDEVGKSDDWDD